MSMPLSFPLPGSLSALNEYVARGDPEEIWVLKENKHRGLGVTPVRLGDIQGKILASKALREKESSSTSKWKYVLAQKFIGRQMLVNDVPFTFRIWTILAGGTQTARSYVFDGSIVPFGTMLEKTKGVSPMEEAKQLIVNLFLQDRSKALDPWSMAELQEYLRSKTGNDDAFDTMWEGVKSSLAATIAAAIPSVRFHAQQFKNYQDNNFEVLGCDFVVDEDMKPWLIEVNYLPSMARKVINCIPKDAVKGKTLGADDIVCEESIFDRQKEKIIEALLFILSQRHFDMGKHMSAARTAVMKRNKALGSKDSCSIDSKTLRAVLNMASEAKVAKSLGFSDITPQLYAAFSCVFHEYADECMALRRKDASCPTNLASVSQKPYRSLPLRLILYIQSVMRRIPGVGTFPWQHVDNTDSAQPSHSKKDHRYNALDAVIDRLLHDQIDLSSLGTDELLERMCQLMQ